MKLHYSKSLLTLLLVFCLSIGLSAQQMISGNVSDEDSSPLTGVSISVKGTDVGTVTDLDGNYQIEASSGDVLVFTYIGMTSQEIAVSSSDPVNVVMVEDATTLSDVIVTTTRTPVRKLETTTAVSVIDAKIIETLRPEGFAEAIQGTPGVYTSQSQGRFRGSVFIRGFPDGSGNGLIYTGILIDGVPSLATPARPPDFAFGMDENVERIEVVRGSAATLFGRASAAGVVNVISRVGGKKHSGTIRTTIYNENVETREGLDLKYDINLNGPITDKLRYNIGGYYVNDRGFRDLGYNDRGGQVRGNFDYLMGKKGSIRLYGGYTDVSIQNMIDIPYRLSDNTPMEGWEITDSYYSRTVDNYTHPFLNTVLGIPAGSIQITDRNGASQSRSIRDANRDGNYAEGGNVGLNINYQLTDWLTVSNLFRYQSYNHGTKFNLGVSNFYFNDPNDPTLPVNFRILIDGDGRDQDVINELRFTIPVVTGNAKHSFSLGTYLSDGNYTPETYSWFYLSSADPDNPSLGFFGDLLGPDGNPILLPDSSTISVPTTVGASPLPFGSVARRDKYDIKVTSFFFGDEIKFGDRTTVNIGGRYDRVKMELQGFYNDPNDVSREEEHSDFSASIGVNHLLGERSAIYGNFVRAFRMPDYSAYSPVDPNSLEDNPDIEDNEIIYNAELGYRTGFGDVGLDFAGFFTNIDNRLATVYEGAIAVQRPLGTNRIVGGELAIEFAPSAIKGLTLRSSFTYQSATFQEFKIAVTDADPRGEAFGNTFINEGTDGAGQDVFSIDLKDKQVPRVPSTIFNFMANYDTKHFGGNIALNYFGNRYADATNIYEMDDILNLNVGVYARVRLTKESDGPTAKFSVLAKNVINTDKALRFLYVADNDAALAQAQAISAGTATAADTYYTGIPFLPRRILFSVALNF